MRIENKVIIIVHHNQDEMWVLEGSTPVDPHRSSIHWAQREPVSSIVKGRVFVESRIAMGGLILRHSHD